MTNETIQNHTPHTINIHTPDGAIVTIAPQGSPVPRVETIAVDEAPIGAIPTVVSRLGPVSNLPPATPGVYLVVSQIVASACPDRDDLLYPYDLVRDDKGRPIGCRALSRIPR